MIELRLCAHLAKEAGHGLGRAFGAGQNLHRDDAPHHGMLGLEDLAHAALADRVDDVVVAEVEFLLAQAELLGLPAIQMIQLDELAGKLFVGCVAGLGAGQEI